MKIRKTMVAILILVLGMMVMSCSSPRKGCYATQGYSGYH